MAYKKNFVKSQQKNFIKLRGIITPCAWGSGGWVTQICLADENENEHVIAPSGQGKALRMHQQELVEVMASFILDKDGRNILLVNKFDVIKDLHSGTRKKLLKDGLNYRAVVEKGDEIICTNCGSDLNYCDGYYETSNGTVCSGCYSSKNFR